MTLKVCFMMRSLVHKRRTVYPWTKNLCALAVHVAAHVPHTREVCRFAFDPGLNPSITDDQSLYGDHLRILLPSWPSHILKIQIQLFHPCRILSLTRAIDN